MPDDARPPFPPFDLHGALEKVRIAEDACNGRNPAKLALAFTIDSRWRKRDETFKGRKAFVAFLTRKYAGESDYCLIKQLWGCR